VGSRGRRLGPALRLAAVLALAWAVTGPFERRASGADQLLAAPTPTPAPGGPAAGGEPPPPAPDGGFSGAPGAFADYFRARRPRLSFKTAVQADLSPGGLRRHRVRAAHGDGRCTTAGGVCHTGPTAGADAGGGRS
jgi:hypothetical protein